VIWTDTSGETLAGTVKLGEAIENICSDVLALSWFMTRFESSGAHRGGEQWNTKTRGFKQVWASVTIKTLCHVCVGCIMIAWVETPSTNSSIG
jgi:hypothetical protein